MAFVTYILLSALIAGLHGAFDPTLLGITCTNASVVILLELVILWLGRYFLNINSESQIYDLVAYSGYKFVGVIVTIAICAGFNGSKGTGGWLGWGVFGYTFSANGFFLVSLPCHSLFLRALTSIKAAECEVRSLTFGQHAGTSEHADHCAGPEDEADAVLVCIQLRGATCVHVVADGD